MGVPATTREGANEPDAIESIAAFLTNKNTESWPGSEEGRHISKCPRDFHANTETCFYAVTEFFTGAT